jgi:hypothetical protein
MLATTQPVSADMTKPVISAFRGQLVVSKDELPTGKNDKDTIAKIKKEQLKELTGTAQEDNVVWNFHYTAFLNKGGAKILKMEFMKAGKLAADKQLDGIDPKSSVLTGDITIDENEGLAKGNTYQVQLVAGNAVVAKTTLNMK